MEALTARDVERLENTSFATVFGAAFEAAGPTEAVVCIESIACDLSNNCTTPVLHSMFDCTAITGVPCITSESCSAVGGITGYSITSGQEGGA